MPKRVQTYETDEISVTFDPEVCVHSAVCLRGLPEVFDVRRRKWVDVKASPPESIAAVIDRCPSGALRYFRKDADAPTAAPAAAVVVRPSPDGPLRISGIVRVESEDGTVLRVADAVALCRCGGTANPPFCDGTHSRNGFRSKR